MVTKSKIQKALKLELRKVDPNMDENGIREHINWPMVNFRHELKRLADIPQVMSISYEFTRDEIEKQLTTAILKSTDRTIRLQYDYKTETVACFAIGKDLDAVRKTIKLEEFIDFVKEYFPPKKKVIIMRKK